MKPLVLKFVVSMTIGLIVVTAFASLTALAAPVDSAGQKAAPTNVQSAPIYFENRQIAILRSPLAGASPQDRADEAARRIGELPLNIRARDILAATITVADEHGIAFLYDGRSLFFIGSEDLDAGSGETMDQVSEHVLQNLDEALLARESERRWPVIRSGLLLTFIGLLIVILASYLIWRLYRWLCSNLRGVEKFFSNGLKLFGADVLPPILNVTRSLFKLLAWILTLAAMYSWLGFSLRSFPYTKPWGDQLGGYVIALFQSFGHATLLSLPGILTVLIIFVLARFIARIGRAFFKQVATGKMRISWMDPDVAHATERIFTAVVWIFAVVVAYPYIPGSSTDAFKGISVLFGLVISLGSTGVINQIMSGLFVVYSKALKTGEWVKVNEIEGEVLEVGPLAAKVRTTEGQQVTIPNSLLVTTQTTNYTRLGGPEGPIASTTVTIGYDAPWRQVHALLLLAAERTAPIRKTPAPYVLQRQLSDFYVEYTLVIRLLHEKLRIETLSYLHSSIQDAFNEFGVQIMSPHFMVQPPHNMVIPPNKWHQAPAESDPGSSEK